jgi:hypothetical protein
LDKNGKEMKRSICKKIRVLADVYHQKILDAAAALQVEAHLSQCPSCRKAYDETRDVLTLLEKDVLPDPGPVFWNQLDSRIMTQVRLSRPEGKEDPWYKKLWINPFGWSGYAWATALLLLLLTPVVIYNISFQGKNRLLIQENKDQEFKWETGTLPLSVVVENLSDIESVRLANKVVARMGKDLPGSTRLLIDNEMHWDVSRTLEGLNKTEIETLIKKMEPGDSVGYMGDGGYVC